MFSLFLIHYNINQLKARELINNFYQRLDIDTKNKKILNLLEYLNNRNNLK